MDINFTKSGGIEISLTPTDVDSILCGSTLVLEQGYGFTSPGLDLKLKDEVTSFGIFMPITDRFK